MTDQEIRRALAEKCMGWTYERDLKRGWWNTPNGSRSDKGWHPLTSDTDFMACVDKMADKRYSIAITYENGEWIVAFQKEDDFRSIEGGTDLRRVACVAIVNALEGRKEP